MAIIDVPVPEAPAELPAFLMNNLNKLPGEAFQPRPVTIFRFPTWFHEINKDLCEPQLVSLGPYHRGKASLRAMEEHKWYTLRDFLARNTTVGCEEYLGEMRMLEAEARGCYSENVSMTSNDFVMMLLLDGCFILEVLRKDAILNVVWAVEGVFCDLFLMENQLPLFVLHKLFSTQSGCGPNCQGPCGLLKLVHGATDNLGEQLRFTKPQIACTQINHLLHLVYSHITAACLQLQAVPVPQKCSMTAADIQLGREQTNSVTSSQSNYILRLRALSQSFPWGKIVSKSGKVEFKNDVSIIPCAAELHEAGVKFRKKRSPRGTFDISFENGTLEMPSIVIDGTRKIIMWNMVGYEQSQPVLEWREMFASSYFALMDSLINTEKDVVILVRAGILQNLLQNEEEVATFFNQFGRLFQLNYGDHYLYEVYKELKKYSESRWHKSRARLMHDYFNNPWSAVSVMAATILLILTLLQTYYSAAK